MNIHLFGAATPSGQAFRDLWKIDLFCYSRCCTENSSEFHFADFNDPETFVPAGSHHSPAIWISFAPIWLLAPFLTYLANCHPDRLVGLRGVIACSSSSVITKRFASNYFDRELVARLTNAEDQLVSTCRLLALPCRILRPTLIYGRVGPFLDQNLSRLITLMRRLPFLPLPAHTGLRQPIHASQLAAVVFEFVRQFKTSGWDSLLPQRITLGGDSELCYSSMLLSLQDSLPHTDPARRCRLLFLPSPLFYAAAAPLLLQSPKSFEAVLRMGADLSGFIPAHQLLKGKPQPFPLQPLL